MERPFRGVPVVLNFTDSDCFLRCVKIGPKVVLQVEVTCEYIHSKSEQQKKKTTCFHSDSLIFHCRNARSRIWSRFVWTMTPNCPLFSIWSRTNPNTPALSQFCIVDGSSKLSVRTRSRLKLWTEPADTMHFCLSFERTALQSSDRLLIVNDDVGDLLYISSSFPHK